MKKSGLILTFLLFPFSQVFSQDSLFNYILASVTNEESVLVRFEMKSGNQCNGITIERSYDSVLFQPVHYISGVCGNSSIPVAYQFEDENPVLNQTNYYRIVPGSGFPTRAVSVFVIDFNTDGYYLYPNPTENQVKIYFKNPEQEKSNLILMNAAGQIIHTEQANTDLWEPDLSDLSAGVYFFSIEVKQQLIRGTFLKN